jgi:hypothetical protein
VTTALGLGSRVAVTRYTNIGYESLRMFNVYVPSAYTAEGDELPAERA